MWRTPLDWVGLAGDDALVAAVSWPLAVPELALGLSPAAAQAVGAACRANRLYLVLPLRLEGGALDGNRLRTWPTTHQ